MAIFNSLGSNYTLADATRVLSSSNNPKYHQNLVSLLESKYSGKATLVYKGREAIELGLKILKLPKGSFVAINGFTCYALYEAVKKAGLEVEYLDIEKGQLNFSSEELEEKISQNPKIKAVLIQNTLGFSCRMEEIKKICKEKACILIEDLAHSVGARYEDGVEAGREGDLVILSFSQDKMIDGVSGGALIVRNNLSVEENLADVPKSKQRIDRFYPLLTYKIRRGYEFGVGKLLHFLLKRFRLLSQPMASGVGGDFHKLPNWYCNLINRSFSELPKHLLHRRAIATIYSTQINPKVQSKTIASRIHLSSNLRFPIFVTNRSELIKYLAEKGVFVSDIWYDAPISPRRFLKLTDYSNQCPNAEIASEEILNLPTHTNVTKKDAEKISQLINQWLSSH